MTVTCMARAALEALTARKNGPTLHDLCDPILRRPGAGDAHISRFYNTALGNPALRPFLRRAGLPELRDPARYKALQTALIAARDDAEPDWEAIGRPVADLLDTVTLQHPMPPRITAVGTAPSLGDIDEVIRNCGRHLLGSFDQNGFIPTYAAFNLVGDPDMRGREFLMALTGLNARGYKNATLLFTLARIFIARSPAHKLINPPWAGFAEPMWEPVQIRHRSAYYDAFFIEALMAFGETGLPTREQSTTSRRAIDAMIEFCLVTSREQVRSHDGSMVDVITALAPLPHPRFSRFFRQIKQDLGFGIYVPDCDTTACAFSAATQAGSSDPILDQPLLDFYAGYQMTEGSNEPLVTVPINDHVGYDGAIVTWIDNLDGQRPFGNDLDPTLNLDVLEVSFRNCTRWQVLENPKRLATVRRIIGFQRRLVASGGFTDPKSHIYYLPELYCAYFGRCYAAFRTLPAETRRQLDADDTFEFIKPRILAYVVNELMAHEMNAFDAALALLALGHLGADIALFSPALQCIARSHGEGGRKGPFKAYEWNKMKTPTRILVGGPEVTSAFVLMALAVARRRMQER